ncbi:uncharacterized protein G2W53_018911 [Senna tora]|uniref:Uncharacterized protein n=1 Tax=Senna tora TaxID=362788 RepID=A0A834TT85_9FABA|nr:uncharacterized protein G2W53_018911 [Senna tora]
MISDCVWYAENTKEKRWDSSYTTFVWQSKRRERENNQYAPFFFFLSPPQPPQAYFLSAPKPISSVSLLPLYCFGRQRKKQGGCGGSNTDLVDTLFSFLSLPLGTIIRLMGKQDLKDLLILGSINNLYHIVENSALIIFERISASKCCFVREIPAIHWPNDGTQQKGKEAKECVDQVRGCFRYNYLVSFFVHQKLQRKRWRLLLLGRIHERSFLLHRLLSLAS